MLTITVFEQKLDHSLYTVYTKEGHRHFWIARSTAAKLRLSTLAASTAASDGTNGGGHLAVAELADGTVQPFVARAFAQRRSSAAGLATALLRRPSEPRCC